MNRRQFLRTAALSGAALATGQVHAAPKFADASWQSLPRWRGFNLLDKFYLKAHEKPFDKTDFDLIAEWGFNFVRLPCDYRIWTEAPGKYRETPLQQLDEGIALARARGIHTLLNLHRAPGYTVAKPPEKLNLWSDGPDGEEARKQFTAQWKMLAERFRNIPSRELSFNLVNEPSKIEAGKYVRACTAAVEGIRSADPDRLVLADGLEWGSIPVPELRSLKIAQATRGYTPHGLSHFRASWVGDTGTWPEPTWPMLTKPSPYLYGNAKAEFQSPLVLRGRFRKGTKISIRITRVSGRTPLLVKADDQILVQKDLKPTPKEQQKTVATTLVEAELPADAREIAFAVEHGDWLQWSEINLQPPTNAQPASRIEAANAKWGEKQTDWTIGDNGQARTKANPIECDHDTLWTKNVEPWVKLRDSGIGVMVGEWGCHNRTPHAVALAWMRDCLANWKRANFGWALWNLRGSFGVLDSERQDVKYESFRGQQLDRAMLEVLRAG